MLSAAHRPRADGVDVVVGVVETHGRAETEAQLKGLEIVPRRSASSIAAACSTRWTSTPS
jgi:two-component system sensor histidine kinase KdpD